MLLCGELIRNEDYGHIFSVAEVPLNGIATVIRCCTLSFSERNVPFPGAQSCFTCTCKAAWDVHVVLLHMYMSYRSTCTCRTALHVHLKQRYTPRLHTLLYEIELYQYRRKRLIAMTNAIKFKTDRKWISSPQRTRRAQRYYFLWWNADERRLKNCSSLFYRYFPLREFAFICVSIKI